MRGMFRNCMAKFLPRCDENGLIQRSELGNYLCDQWSLGDNEGVKRWGNSSYYDHINGYDSSYEGISLQDFVETDALINIDACTECLENNETK